MSGFFLQLMGGGDKRGKFNNRFGQIHNIQDKTPQNDPKIAAICPNFQSQDQSSKFDAFFSQPRG